VGSRAVVLRHVAPVRHGGVATFGRRLGEVASNGGDPDGYRSSVLGGASMFGGYRRVICTSPSQQLSLPSDGGGLWGLAVEDSSKDLWSVAASSSAGGG
jgi:hypothetical protein